MLYLVKGFCDKRASQEVVESPGPSSQDSLRVAVCPALQKTAVYLFVAFVSHLCLQEAKGGLYGSHPHHLNPTAIIMIVLLLGCLSVCFLLCFYH